MNIVSTALPGSLRPLAIDRRREFYGKPDQGKDNFHKGQKSVISGHTIRLKPFSNFPQTNSGYPRSQHVYRNVHTRVRTIIKRRLGGK